MSEAEQTAWLELGARKVAAETRLRKAREEAERTRRLADSRRFRDTPERDAYLNARVEEIAADKAVMAIVREVWTFGGGQPRD